VSADPNLPTLGGPCDGRSVVDPAAFVRSAARLAPVPCVEEISLYQAGDIYQVWHGTEQATGRPGLDPPFWAFAWPGGQALARHLLDHPDLVAGRTVLDFGTGSGLVAIAAAKAGAVAVTAVDADPFARAAAGLNGAANSVTLSVVAQVLGTAPAAEVVLAGDVWYDRELAAEVMSFLDAAAVGAEVLAGDIGRRYFPRQRFQRLASYRLPVSEALESAETLDASVWVLLGNCTTAE
jgi:predicted nicotinamide N-methyase